MKIYEIYSTDELHAMAQDLFKEERAKKRLDGWFIAQELCREVNESHKGESEEMIAALCLKKISENIPLTISKNNIFAGTQDDAFARTYALINPAFRVETFTGYCDPGAIFSDIEPNEEFTKERIQDTLEYYKTTPYFRDLSAVNEEALPYSKEAVFFVEQVTGHVIPDFQPLIKNGIDGMLAIVEEKLKNATVPKHKETYEAMKLTYEAYLTFADRYAKMAEDEAKTSSGKDLQRLQLIAETMRGAVHTGAKNLYEAIQLLLMAWMCMCDEQETNPYAFSVGNADRIFEPYRAMENTGREEACRLFEHLLVFYNVGDRSWAISQNLIVGGKSSDGKDLTSLMSYSVLDAYYAMNLPQPILSVKLHKDTPQEFYESLGRFLFTPGCLTPSFFNDDVVFKILDRFGVAHEDLENYTVAGCQEPLIMGKDNGNTTNTWLNLGKILEITLNNGYSTISGTKIGMSYKELGYADEEPLTILKGVREAFYKNLEVLVPMMADVGNKASRALSHLRTPFLSTAMGGIESGIDMRDADEQGTPYNGSGCLIHGTTVVADSFIAIDELIEKRPEDAGNLLEALRKDFEGYEELHQFLLSAPKFGNAIDRVDDEAEEIAIKVANLVNSQKNYLGNGFRADFSTPSTHLLYGYWVGALPSGRKAREMLNYGIDPLYGEASNGIGFRVLSARKMPFELMRAGNAMHFGLDPKYFKGETYEEKGIDFRDKIMKPLFFGSDEKVHYNPFYLYVNVATPEMLRKVLENPKKYAPSGVYIVRIHGTFVNFLDLSPDIQQDIIKRLDLGSTTC